MISRAYKCRLYPNKEQQRQIDFTIDACRWVWNQMLELKDAAYKANGTSLGTTDLCKHLTVLKRTTSGWLSVAPNSALQQSIRDLDSAYRNFFRRVKEGSEDPGYPKFKKRGTHQSYRTPAAGRLDKGTGKYVGQCVRVVDARHVVLPKLGTVKCRLTQMPEGHLMSATVSKTPTGKYFVSLCCVDVPDPECEPGVVDVMGVRVGVTSMMVRSDGIVTESPKALKKYQKKLRREQRRLSRRKRGSNNYEKQRQKVALVNERIANMRRDAIHKATTNAVRDSRAVAVGDLAVKQMMRDHKVARSVADASMFEVTRQLEYKCGWYGRDFVKVDRETPFSRTCMMCGAVSGPSGLKQPTWVCSECGTVHDTALNAARNIASAGAIELKR